MVEQRFGSVGEYVATFPDPVREALEQVRAALHEAVPGSQETISYHMPTLVHDGRPLVHFAGWKQHVSLYPAPDGDASFEERVAPYRSGASTLRFRVDRPLPVDLVAEVARLLAAREG